MSYASNECYQFFLKKKKKINYDHIIINLFSKIRADLVSLVAYTEFFSGLHFSIFRLNTEIYRLNPGIQSEYGKIRTRKNFVFGHFSCIDWLQFHLQFAKLYCNIHHILLKVHQCRFENLPICSLKVLHFQS